MTSEASNGPLFSRGEQVVIDAPGRLLDRHVATVGGCHRAGSVPAWLYTVTIDWPNGDSRIYSVWETQLSRADAAERSAGDGG
jgi:hypothetical protein